MKRPWRIFIAVIVLALVAYAGSYFALTHRQRAIQQESAPELAWLKTEYGLSDEQFTRVCELHLRYQPHCQEMCDRIRQHNAELSRLIASTNRVTPEIEGVLKATAQLRQDCQKMMLDHFFAVSRAMPPDQGRRYLSDMRQQTTLDATH